MSSNLRALFQGTRRFTPGTLAYGGRVIMQITAFVGLSCLGTGDLLVSLDVACRASQLVVMSSIRFSYAKSMNAAFRPIFGNGLPLIRPHKVLCP